MAIGYSKLSEITVTNQAEMDAVPDDFKGRIYIKCTATVAVKKRYYWRVVAWGNSSVEASGNSQIVNLQINGRIQTSGNAREVFMPKTIHEFMDFYGIKHTKKTATFYKAVRKDENGYYSNHDSYFRYDIGKTATEQCNPDTAHECSCGIHIAHLDWALRFGGDWGNLAILEVETDIADIVMPNNTDGKVHTSKIKVIREVPLEECGVYGKILAKRRTSS